MASLDTHKLVPELEDAGAPEPLAGRIVKTAVEVVDVHLSQYVTKVDLYRALFVQMAGFTGIVALLLVLIA